MAKLGRILIGILLFGFVACSEQELVSNLSDGDSIDALVLLNQSGIHASREKAAKGAKERYSVNVGSADYINALKVLREYGVPRGNTDTFEQLTEPDGMMPNIPAVSAMRADRALALQLERHLAGLPGVINVTAIVRSESANNSSAFFPTAKDGNSSKGSASIIVRYAAAGDALPFDLEEMRRIASNAAAGIAADQIEITAVRVELAGALGVDKAGNGKGYVLRQISPFSFRIAEVDTDAAVKQLVMLIILLACGFLVLGIGIGRKTAKRRPKSGSAEGDVRGLERSFLGERPVVEGDAGPKRLSS